MFMGKFHKKDLKLNTWISPALAVNFRQLNNSSSKNKFILFVNGTEIAVIECCCVGKAVGETGVNACWKRLKAQRSLHPYTLESMYSQL